MDVLLSFFNVNNTLFTILGYPISYLEFTGTLFNLASVWLVAKRNILTWPVSLVGVILFGILFYQIQLYADFFEQIYYFITAIWGWYLWRTTKNKDTRDDKVTITTNTRALNIRWLLGIGAGTIILGYALSNIHLWLPALFPFAASAVLLDSLTTVMSFAATILMIQRRVEAWVLWVLVDIIAIGLYWYKSVPFIALLYVLFLIIATKGLVDWHREAKNIESQRA